MKMKMKAALSVLLLAALTGSSTALFWRNYIYVDKELNWNDAQAYCRENYVDLATIEIQMELKRFQDESTSHFISWCWIGLKNNWNIMRFTQQPYAGSARASPYSDNTHSDNESCVSAKTEKYSLQTLWTNSFCTYRQRFICYTWKPDVIVVQEMKTWDEALRYCRMNYTDLLSLDTQSDQLVVNKMTSQVLTPHFWTALHFLDGSWFWVNQAQINEQSLESFIPSCPAPGFRCGAQNTESNVLENRACEEKMNFICYKQNW